MHLPWKRFLFVLVLVFLDQWSKSAVFTFLDPETVRHATPDGVVMDPGLRQFRWIGWEPYFGFMLSRNPGAAFGGFADFPHLLIWGRVLAIGLLSWFVWQTPKAPWFFLVAVVLVLSGAMGNLIDNFWTGPHVGDHPYGLVRDFLDVWFVSADGGAGGWGWNYHFPTFNVADSYISVGAVLWIVGSFFGQEPVSSVPNEDLPNA